MRLVSRFTLGYLGLVGMSWGWFVGAVMGQVRPPVFASRVDRTEFCMLQWLVYSLAELSSAYPTSGGLYYWFAAAALPNEISVSDLCGFLRAYMTAAPQWKLFSCYICAWSMVISTPLFCCSITYAVSLRSISILRRTSECLKRLLSSSLRPSSSSTATM